MPDSFTNELFSGQNVLKLQIGPIGAKANRPGGYSSDFYNTQGRKFDLGQGVTVLRGDLYIPTDWSNSHRRSDLWGTTYKSSAPSTPVSYPIIGFANTESNNPCIRYWDGSNWTIVTTNVNYNTWYSFRMELTADNVYYYMNDVLVGTIANTNEAEYFGNTIVQAYNFADAALPQSQQDLNNLYDVYWDNIGGITKIHNATSNTYHTSIQTAIDAASNFDVINVGRGFYNEELTINKPLTLNGAKANIDPRPSIGSSRTINGSDESIITAPSNNVAINITSGNVTLNGFQIKQVGVGAADMITSPATPIKTNLNLINNILIDASDEAIQIRGFDSAYARRNYTVNSKGDGINFCDNINATYLLIEENEIHTSQSEHGGIFLYTIKNVDIVKNIIKDCNNGIRLSRTSASTIVSDVKIMYNEITGEFNANNSVSGLRVQGPGTNNVLVSNNKIIAGNNPKTAFSCIQSYNNVTNVKINENYLQSGGSIYMRFAYESGNTGGPTAEVDATCNWFGTTNAVQVEDLVTGDGNRVVEPFLINDTDSDNGALGFVPAPFACGGAVRNITKNIYYTTINDAITAASPNDSIEVNSGTFNTGNITISKPLVLLGANANIDPNSGTRGAETVIENSQWTTTGGTNAKIVINGFRFYQTINSNLNVIQAQPTTGGTLVVSNNIFYRNGASSSSGQYIAIMRVNSVGTVVIENNKFDASVLGGAFTSNGRIWRAALWNNSNNGYTVVKNNYFNRCASALNLDGIAVSDTFNNNIFANNGTQISFGNTIQNYSLVMTGNEFLTPASTYFNTQNLLNNNFRLDVSGCTFPHFNTNNITGIKSVNNNFINTNNTKGYIKWYPGFHIINQTIKNRIGSIAALIEYAQPNDSILLLSGVIDTITSTITLNKPLTIRAETNNSGVTFRGSYLMSGIEKYFLKITSTSTIDGVKFEKTDKTGSQNILGIQANDVTIQNCTFTGKFVLDVDDDVSRAIEYSPGRTNLSFLNNTVKDLRQPGYLQGSGTITNNSVEGTRGFVVDGNADLNFTGNTFKNNLVDIAIIPTVNPSLFTDLVALSDANNNAFVQDQRHTPNISGAAQSYVSTTGNDDNNDFAKGTQAKPYGTIQKGIERILPGQTVHITAGTFNENVIVNKTVNLHGANVNINPNSGTRGAETILRPATSDIVGGVLIDVQASDVTINGLTLDGDNTTLSSGYLGTNNADLDAAYGILVQVNNINNINVVNNIIQNVSYQGVSLFGGSYSAPMTTGHVIKNNLVRNLGTYDAQSNIANWGGGVLLYNNHYTRVESNVFDNVRIGVQTGNFQKAHNGSADYQVITDNTINARRRGIFYNLHNHNPFTISNNTITAIVNANESVWDGILLASLSTGVNCVNNTIDGSNVSVPSEGYEVWNVSLPATIEGGNVSGVDVGLFINNWDGYNSNASYGANATVSGLVINADSIGIKLLDNPSSTHANVSLTFGQNVEIDGGTHGLWIENENAFVGNGGETNNLSFANLSGDYIRLVNNTYDVMAQNSIFDIPAPNSVAYTLTNAQRNQIENRILDQNDDIYLGQVYLSNDPLVKVTIRNSEGNPISGVAIKQITNNVTSNFGTTNAAGYVTKSLTPYNYYQFSVTYNNTTFVTDSFPIISGILDVNLYTTKFTFQAKDEQGNDVSGVSAHYYAGGNWRSLGTTSIGTPLEKEVFPGTYDVRGVYNYTTSIIPVTVSGNGYNVNVDHNHNSYLTKVVINGLDPDNTAVPAIANTYLLSSSTSWRTFGNTDSNGTVVKYLYPETLMLRSTYNNTTYERQIVINGDGLSPDSTIINTYLSRLVINGRRSNDNIVGITGINTYINTNNAWRSIGNTTTGNGTVSTDIFPGNYNVRATLSVSADTFENYLVVGTGDTANAISVLDLYPHQITFLGLNSDSVGVQGISNQFKLSSVTNWSTAGTTNANGVYENLYLFPGEYDFRSNYKNTEYVRTINLGGTSLVPVTDSLFAWLTKVTVRGMRSSDNTAAIPSISTRYFAQNAWRTFGTTNASGVVDLDLFPGQYDFSGTLNSTSDTLYNVTISGNGATSNVKQNVDFYPTQVTLLALNSDSVGVVSVAHSFKPTPSAAWRSIGNSNDDGIKDEYYIFPGEYEFKSTYNYTDYIRSVNLSGNSTAPALDTLNAWLTTVQLNAKNYDGTPVTTGGNFTNQYVNVGSPNTWRNFGNMNNGQAVNYYFPVGADLTIRSTYRYTTSKERPIILTGTGAYRVPTNVVDIYLSRVQVTATSFNNEKVQGVSTTYRSGNNMRSVGTTDANGETFVDLFGNDTSNYFVSTYVGTVDTTYAVIDGGTTGADSGKITHINLVLNKVSFANSGTVHYYGGNTWRSVPASGAYVFPGVYEFRFRNNVNYIRDIDVNQLNFNKAAAIIELKDELGNPVSIDAARGGNNSAISWHVTGAVSKNNPGVWIDISNYNASTSTRIYEVKKNSALTTKTQDLMVDNLFTFTAITITLKLQNCNNQGIAGGTVRAGYSSNLNANPNISFHWPGGATDANGYTSIFAFAGAYKLEMKVGPTTQEKLMPITSSDTIVWNTVNVKLNYPGAIAMGKSSISQFFSKPSMELLPGSMKFSFRTSNTPPTQENIVDIEIPDTVCSIEKTAVIVRLQSAPNVGLSGGLVKQGAWVNLGYTENNGNFVYLLDGNPTTVSTGMEYNGSRTIKNNINIASVNNVVVYQTTPVTFYVLDVNDNQTDSITRIQSFGDLVHQYTTIVEDVNGGSYTTNLFTGTYKFKAFLNGTSQERDNVVITGSNDTVIFKASRAEITFTNSNTNLGIEDAIFSYRANGWNYGYSAPTDASGYTYIDLFATNMYDCRMEKDNVQTGTQNVSIGYDTTIQLTFTSNTIVSGNNNGNEKSNNGESNISNTRGDQSISVYPNPAVSYIDVKVPSNNSTIEIYTIDGRKVKHIETDRSLTVIDIAQFASGTYHVVVTYGNTRETTKFIKE